MFVSKQQHSLLPKIIVYHHAIILDVLRNTLDKENAYTYSNLQNHPWAKMFQLCLSLSCGMTLSHNVFVCILFFI